MEVFMPPLTSKNLLTGNLAPLTAQADVFWIGISQTDTA